MRVCELFPQTVVGVYHEPFVGGAAVFRRIWTSAPLKAAFAFAVLVDPERVATFASQVREGSALPGTAASLWNRAASEGILTSGNSIESRKAACLRALRILRSVLASEPPPKKIYVTEETVLWFLERVKGPSSVLWFLERVKGPSSVPPPVADASAVVATRSTPSPRGSALRGKICGLLASGLSVRAADVGQALGISRHHAKNLLLKMSILGEARKLGRGLYAGPAPAC